MQFILKLYTSSGHSESVRFVSRDEASAILIAPAVVDRWATNRGSQENVTWSLRSQPQMLSSGIRHVRQEAL